MPRTGILMVGHGSREQAANREFEELVEHVRTRRPDFDVRHAYVGPAAPSLSEGLEAIARANDRVAVIPCLLFAAGHVKNDIPLALEAVQAKYPAVEFPTGRVLGVNPAMAELAFQRAVEAGGAETEAKRTAVVIVGRGASDPEANSEFCKLVLLFAERRGFGWVVPTFIGITRPLVDESIELIARSHPERIVIIPYLLFGGRLVARLEKQIREFRLRYPKIAVTLTAQLGIHAKLFEAIDERIDETLAGRARSPGDE